MTATKSEIAQIASTLPNAPSAEVILEAWNSCCKFLEASMSQGKAWYIFPSNILLFFLFFWLYISFLFLILFPYYRASHFLILVPSRLPLKSLMLEPGASFVNVLQPLLSIQILRLLMVLTIVRQSGQLQTSLSILLTFLQLEPILDWVETKPLLLTKCLW